jgi:hypothetical protein
VWAVLLIFAFLTASLSRRSYYILPILPFAALAVGDWIAAGSSWEGRRAWSFRLGAVAMGGMAVWFAGGQPWVSSPTHLRALGEEVRREAERRAPWAAWDLVVWDAPEEAVFYLGPKARAVACYDAGSVEAHLRAHPRSLVVVPQSRLERARAILPRALVLRQPDPPAPWASFRSQRARREPLAVLIPD